MPAFFTILVSIALGAISLAADGPGFAARPGVMEFSGRVIAREAAWLRVPAAHNQPLRNQLPGLLGLAVHRRFPETSEWVIRVPAGLNEATYSTRLMSTGFFEYAQPDWICYPATVPNDPLYSTQWHHQVMASPTAWDRTTGSTECIIAIVDTGVEQEHPDLAPLLVPGFNSVTNTAEVNGGEVYDINGHGTWVTGCAAAVGDNLEGIAGVGWGLSIMPVRATNSPSGAAAVSDLLRGARWAAQNGARVINVSYTGVSSPSVESTGQFIRDQGGILVYSADNSNIEHGDFDWSSVLVVGATDLQDGKAEFSSYGLALDLYAPGVDILTTHHEDAYIPRSGTSYAAPLVSGALGLILSVAPELTPAQVENVLVNSCDDLGPSGNDDYWGHGRLNVGAAVALADLAVAPAAPHASPDAVSTPPWVSTVVDVLDNDFDANNDAISIAAFDELSAAGGTVSLSIGTGPNGRDELLYNPPAGYIGEDSFGYVLTDGTAESSGVVTVTVGDAAAARPADVVEYPLAGLRESYFAVPADATSLPDFSALTALPDVGAVALSISFPETEDVFAVSGMADQVGARFTGYFDAPQLGSFQFSLNSDEGARLYIGDELIVDNDGVHAMQTEAGKIALQPGFHRLRIDYFELTGPAGLVAGVQGPAGLDAVLAGDLVWHARCLADLNGDLVVDDSDLGILLSVYGYCTTDELFLPAADLNDSGCIEDSDLGLLLSDYQVPCPE